jgi:hypothetical protein
MRRITVAIVVMLIHVVGAASLAGAVVLVLRSCQVV